MAGEGFEPSKAEPRGLQPRPFDRSGTPPRARESKRSVRTGPAAPERASCRALAGAGFSREGHIGAFRGWRRQLAPGAAHVHVLLIFGGAIVRVERELAECALAGSVVTADQRPQRRQLALAQLVSDDLQAGTEDRRAKPRLAVAEQMVAVALVACDQVHVGVPAEAPHEPRRRGLGAELRVAVDANRGESEQRAAGLLGDERDALWQRIAAVEVVENQAHLLRGRARPG